MEIKKISKETKSIIISAVLLILGILFCCSNAMGITALSYVIGICFIAVGTTIIINSIIQNKALLNSTCIIGSALIAFGILFAGHELFWIIFNYVPWFLMILGALIIIDSVIKKLNENNNAVFIAELIIGIIILTLGILLKCIPKFTEFSSIMLGIILIIYAVYSLSKVFIKNNNSIK